MPQNISCSVFWKYNQQLVLHLDRNWDLKVSKDNPFSMYSILEGLNGPLILSIDLISALAGSILLDGSGLVLWLKLDENP